MIFRILIPNYVTLKDSYTFSRFSRTRQKITTTSRQDRKPKKKKIRTTINVIKYFSQMFKQFIRKMSSSIPQIIKSENPGPIEASIISKITNEFKPSYFKIVNDSHKHAHHAGIRGATNVTESHFRLEIISDVFDGKTLPFSLTNKYSFYLLIIYLFVL